MVLEIKACTTTPSVLKWFLMLIIGCGSLSFQCQVELNRKVLVDLAIYEPKTFKSLAALAKRRQQEGFAAALGDGKEPEGIFSRVVQYH